MFELVDVGEETPRTICSGLVGHVPMETLDVSFKSLKLS